MPDGQVLAGSRNAWWLLVAWLVLLETGTSLPGSMLPHESYQLDKVVHFGLYMVLFLLLARALRRTGWPARRLWLVVVIVSAFAALDELHQLFIPGRDADVLDWSADTVGALTGLWFRARLLKTQWRTWLE